MVQFFFRFSKLYKIMDISLEDYQKLDPKCTVEFESKKLPIPDYIKIDVDGFEHKVIEGATETLKNKKIKSVIIELSPHLSEHMASVEILQNLGFKFSQDQVDQATRKEGPFKGMSEYVFRR